jgi:hypothetical protein
MKVFFKKRKKEKKKKVICDKSSGVTFNKIIFIVEYLGSDQNVS